MLHRPNELCSNWDSEIYGNCCIQPDGLLYCAEIQNTSPQQAWPRERQAATVSLAKAQ